MQHYARIRSLRSDQRQKDSQVKLEHAANNHNLKEVISTIYKETSSNLKKNKALGTRNEERK